MSVYPNYVSVTAGSGSNLDTAQVTIGGVTVQREIISIGNPDSVNPAQYAGVDGIGNLQVTLSYDGPTAERLDMILQELHAMRLALVALVTEDGSNAELDFDPNYFAAENNGP